MSARAPACNDERSSYPRNKDRGPRRGRVRSCVSQRDHARRAGAEARARDGPPTPELAVEHRRAERVRRLECGIEAALVNAAPPPPLARRDGPPAPEEPVPGEVLPRAFVEIAGRRVPIAPGGSVIGRSTDADIVVAAHEVSRRHAQILPDRDGWTLTDLDSTNGVRLNGRPIGVPTRLQDGDVIELGAVEILFEVR
ncbi:MAG: FHA domain-containing protein [Solirubrobacteraceae bacterium]